MSHKKEMKATTHHTPEEAVALLRKDREERFSKPRQKWHETKGLKHYDPDKPHP